jgi:hypothetical protein
VSIPMTWKIHIDFEVPGFGEFEQGPLDAPA